VRRKITIEEADNGYILSSNAIGPYSVQVFQSFLAAVEEAAFQFNEKGIGESWLDLIRGESESLEVK